MMLNLKTVKIERFLKILSQFFISNFENILFVLNGNI